MKKQKYIIGFPKTTEEIAMWGFYISLSIISILLCFAIARSCINLLIFNKSINWEFMGQRLFIIFTIYLFNETAFRYLHFPFFLLSPEKIYGISFYMGIPIPFSILLEHIDTLEEVYIPHWPSLWKVTLKKQNWYQFWMKKRFYISPFIKEDQQLISLLKSNA
ncbi:MAG: hypothetical protein JEZ00_09645 [Anaerolineaceae bacterium]|nr:hypothetical protein [Anaerolineaceae bacterium]